MKIVIAGNYHQFNNWLRENKLSPHEAIYADSEEKLLGMSFTESDVVRVGEYWRSPVSDAFLRTRMIHAR